MDAQQDVEMSVNSTEVLLPSIHVWPFHAGFYTCALDNFGQGLKARMYCLRENVDRMAS